MSAFDDLRATLAAAPADAVCVWGTVDQLRAVVAEHDALREAQRREAFVARHEERMACRCHACGAPENGAPLRPEEQHLADEMLRGVTP